MGGHSEIAMETARLIEHTALGAEIVGSRVDELCAQAAQYGFLKVMVPPCWVERAVMLMKGTGIGVGSVVGFPFGNETTATKSDQAAALVAAGATDVDMVINIGWIKDGRWDDVELDIQETVRAARDMGVGEGLLVVKVIIETALLSDGEKTRAASVIEAAGADFVKTSTGYAAHGATVADVTLLKKAVGDRLGIKASGGIRNLAQLRSLVAAGADVIGTSAGVAIIRELESGRK